MPTIPPWLLGRHVTFVEITPMAVAATGAITAGTAVPLVNSTGDLHSNLAFTLGLVDEIEFTQAKSTENISAIDRTRAHYVPIAAGRTFTITEIMRNGVSQNLLANAWSASSQSTGIYRFRFVRGRGRFTVYGVMTDYEEASSRGKNVARLTFRTVDTGYGGASSGVAFETGKDQDEA